MSKENEESNIRVAKAGRGQELIVKNSGEPPKRLKGKPSGAGRKASATRQGRPKRAGRAVQSKTKGEAASASSDSGTQRGE